MMEAITVACAAVVPTLFLACFGYVYGSILDRKYGRPYPWRDRP